MFTNCPLGTGNASEKELSFASANPLTIVAVLSSDVFWWYYSTHYDMFNLGSYQVKDFRIFPFSESTSSILAHIGRKFVKSLFDNAEYKDVETNHGIITQVQFYIRKSKPIINEIDKVLAKHYGFTDEELDFIINYDIKYRMGDELNNEE